MPREPDHWSQAFRGRAKRLHPDKGGDAREFGKLQDAFRVLTDVKRRTVYDEWAKELEFRYVRGVAGRAEGGEGVLLDDFANMGIHCDPATQLVITCEVCRRPSNRECWTCGMKICEFCTLKRHWKDDFPLHWPLINSDHMRTRLAKREFEKKRIEDAQRLALQDPNHRTEAELQDIRSFRAAAYEMVARQDRLVSFDLSLARFYMWAQTEQTVFIAVRVPTGYEDKELLFDCNQSGLNLQPEDSPPVIQRAFDYAVDSLQPIETFRSLNEPFQPSIACPWQMRSVLQQCMRMDVTLAKGLDRLTADCIPSLLQLCRTQDNRVFTIALPKGQHGENWLRLFRGDSDGVRCMQPPYQLAELEDEVVMDITVPFWTESEDVKVAFRSSGLSVEVRSVIKFSREYWTRPANQPGSVSAAVDAENSTWSMDEEPSPAGGRCRALSILLARPPLTDDEVKWKKGIRQDNRQQDRKGTMMQKGVRFFKEDEDEFVLEEILQALCFLEAGSTFVPPKPWDHGSDPKFVDTVEGLSQEVQDHLTRLLDEEEHQHAA